MANSVGQHWGPDTRSDHNTKLLNYTCVKHLDPTEHCGKLQLWFHYSLLGSEQVLLKQSLWELQGSSFIAFWGRLGGKRTNLASGTACLYIILVHDRPPIG